MRQREGTAVWWIPSRASTEPSDAGFTLVETIMSVFVIGVVMAALTSFFVTSMAVVGQQSGVQVATQVATSLTSKVRSMRGSALATGRDKTTSDAQWASPVTGVAPYLVDMTEAWDASAAAQAGLTAPLPTVVVPVLINNVAFQQSVYLGRCWQALAGGVCGATAATGPVPFFRVVVAVTWRERRCPTGSCSYVTSTLVSSAATEPLFNSNAGAGAPPQVVAPDQSDPPNVAVNRQLTTTPGGQCPLTFSFVGLPSGVVGSSSGQMSGTVPAAGGSYPVTVTLRDASNTVVDSRSFTWAVGSSPYPTMVVNDSPWAYHRLEEARSSALMSTATDTSGNGRAGSYVGRTDGPSTSWDFDEGTGTTAADDSGAVNTGTLGGAGTTWTTSGRFNGAVTLNGTSTGYVSSVGPAVATNSSFTVSAWAYPSMASPGGAISTVLTQSGTNSGFYLQQNHGNWKFVLPDADTTVSGGATVADPDPITLNTWTHLVGVYDSSTGMARLYVNGVSKGTPVARGATWNATGALQAGRAKWNGTFVDYWQGRLDEITTYRRAMSATEVRDLYGDELRWDLSEASGTGTADAGDRRNDGTLGSAATFTTGRTGNGVTMSNSANGYLQSTAKGVHTDQSWSVSTWAYLSSSGTGTTRAIVSEPGVTSSGFILKYDSGGKWRLDIPRDDTTSPPADYLESGTAAATNTWVHLVGVYDDAADLGKLYVNGVLVDSNAQTDPTEWDAVGPLQVGRSWWNGAWRYPWYGKIDTLRVYQRALSQTDINSLYADVDPPDQTGVYAHDVDSEPDTPSTAWSFDETSGTGTTDRSGNGNTGTLTGAGTTRTTTGRPNGAVAFNASTSNAVTGAAAITPNAAFTVSAWARLDGTAAAGQHSVVSQSAVHTSGFNLKGESANKWQFTMSRSDIDSAVLDRATSTTDINVDAWNHVVAVYDPSASPQMKLYVNDVLAGTATHTTVMATTGSLQVGRSWFNTANTDAFDGQIDEVRTYRRVLTAAEIDLLYTGGTPGAEAPMTAALPGALQGATQGQQSRTAVAFDGTSNAYNSTLVAAPGPVNFTTECWFRTTSTVGGQLVAFTAAASGDVATARDRMLYLDSGNRLTFGIYWSGTSRTVRSPSTYNDGNWHHAAGSYGPAGLKLYADGVLVASNPAYTQAANPAGAFAGYWRWGGGHIGNPQWTNNPVGIFVTATMDEVAVYHTQLTDQQIAAHYNSDY